MADQQTGVQHDLYLSKTDYDSNFVYFEKIADRRMKNINRFLLTRLELSSQILMLSLKQWSNFMIGNEKWMGNSSIEEEGFIQNYSSLSTLSCAHLTKNVFRAQHARSSFLSNSQKIDIFDIKNEFRNMIGQIIRQENMKTGTMRELEKAVIERVKEYIQKERPRMITDEVWRIFYMQRLQTQKTFAGFGLKQSLSYVHPEGPDDFLEEDESAGEEK